MRLAAALLLSFLVSDAAAQTFAPPPFTFQAGAPANASQMMANFQAFVDNGNAVSTDLAARVAGKRPFPSGTIAFFHLAACPVAWTLQSAYGTRFIRGLDLGRGYDMDNELGQLEGDLIQAHKHSVTSVGKSTATNGPGNFTGGTVGRTNYLATKDGSFNVAVDSGAHGSEVRPDAVSLLICRKD